jgi:phage terminase large subunit-like protein
LLACDPIATKAFLDSLSDEEALMALTAWELWARPEQLPPSGDWTTWLYMGGRGAGKTRAGAEWVRARAVSGAAKRIALVAATFAEARDVMIEGESGLLAISSPIDRPRFEKSKRRLTWPNGAVALCFSDDEPDMLRGAQHDTAWCDELAKWKHLEASWANLLLGLRLGERPRAMITTTPRTKKGLKAIIAHGDTVLTRGSTRANVWVRRGRTANPTGSCF